MTLLHFEGFEGLPHTTEVTNYYAYTTSDIGGSAATISHSARTGEHSLELATINIDVMSFLLPASYTTTELICGIAVLPAQSSWIHGPGFMTGKYNTDLEITVGGNGEGAICLWQGQPSSKSDFTGCTLLGSTSNNLIDIGRWHYIELRLRAGTESSDGEAEVRLDGNSLFTVSNLNVPAITHCSPVVCGHTGPGMSPPLWDDWYILDGSGSLHNTFLGPVRVAALEPTGAGDSTDFTPVGAANNYENVDDTDAPNDSTYNESSTLGHKDLFTISDIPSAASLHAVMVRNRYLHDATSQDMAPVVKLSATEEVGDAFAPSATIRNNSEIFPEKPGGGTWSTSDIANTQVGYKIV